MGAWPQGEAAKLLGMKLDLTLMAILCSGNDYLPGMPSIALTSELFRPLMLRAASDRRSPQGHQPETRS